jgi:hypothetical protein
MEAPFEVGQGPEGAVVPWMDGWMAVQKVGWEKRRHIRVIKSRRLRWAEHVAHIRKRGSEYRF